MSATSDLTAIVLDLARQADHPSNSIGESDALLRRIKELLERAGI